LLSVELKYYYFAKILLSLSLFAELINDAFTGHPANFYITVVAPYTFSVLKILSTECCVSVFGKTL